MKQVAFFLALITLLGCDSVPKNMSSVGSCVRESGGTPIYKVVEIKKSRVRVSNVTTGEERVINMFSDRWWTNAECP